MILTRYGRYALLADDADEADLSASDRNLMQREVEDEAWEADTDDIDALAAALQSVRTFCVLFCFADASYQHNCNFSGEFRARN